MINIAICDDEKLYIREIYELTIAFFKEKNIDYNIDTFTSGLDFLKKESEIENYTAIFLDIDMPNMNGIDVAQIIRKYSEDIIIIFETAFYSWAQVGYKVNASRYVLKNGTDNFSAEINEALNYIYFTVNKRNEIPLYKSFKFSNSKKYIKVDSIIYIESKLHRLIFHFDNGSENEYMYGKLNELEEELKPYEFIRCHQSYIINPKHILQLNNSGVKLCDNTHINISKSKLNETKIAFLSYMGEF